MVYSRSENCVFPALRCGPAGQGFAPGNTMFYGWNICVSGTILTCLMVGSGLKIPLAGAIFWMYFILVLQFRQLCHVYLYCEKVQNIMKNHEKRRYFLNLESTDFKPGVSEIVKYSAMLHWYIYFVDGFCVG